MILVAACCAAVTLGVLILALPHTLEQWTLSRDGIGYIGTAHNWLRGAGFVDPVVYSYYLPEARPPVPAFAVRPPVVSLLFAVPLVLGGGVTSVTVFHTIWASLVAALALLVARRTMSLAAATGFAIALTWSTGWILLSQKPLTEVSAVAILLLALAQVRAGMGSARGALLLSCITLLGWMTRPNLGVILPAVVLAAVLDRGPRAALRSRPLWVYVGSFVVLHRAVVWMVEAATGFAPYAHYGVMAEIIDMEESHLYLREYVGWAAFLRENLGAVFDALAQNLRSSWDKLFLEPFYLRVGWLAIPGLVYALLRGGEGSLERRFAVCAALGFAAVALATYGGFSPIRYLLLAVACAWFAAMALADDCIAGVASRCRPPWLRGLVRGLPAVLAIALVATQGGAESVRDAREAWRKYDRRGTSKGERRRVQARRAACDRVDPDAVVASIDPWEFYLWCGNAGLMLPQDIQSVEWVDRYLDEQRPGYVVLNRNSMWEAFRSSDRLRRLAFVRPFSVYEVTDAGPESRTWVAPRPLASLGSGPDAAGSR